MGKSDPPKLNFFESRFYIPLKIEEENGEETWVKVNKNSLKKRLNISDKELAKAKETEAVAALIEKKLTESSNSLATFYGKLKNLKDNFFKGEEFIQAFKEIKNFLKTECKDLELNRLISNFCHKVDRLASQYHMREKDDYHSYEEARSFYDNVNTLQKNLRKKLWNTLNPPQKNKKPLEEDDFKTIVENESVGKKAFELEELAMTYIIEKKFQSAFFLIKNKIENVQVKAHLLARLKRECIDTEGHTDFTDEISKNLRSLQI